MGISVRGAAKNSWFLNTSTAISVASLIVAAFVVATTLYGVVRFYSPIIWFDEWDGYLGFYLSTLGNLGLQPWWEPHVEHRIITSRVLYWLDLRYFHGAHVILFGAEQLGLAGIVIVVMRAYTDGRARVDRIAWVIGIGAALMFSWVQSEILKWGFETCVVLAYFFATSAAYLFTRDKITPPKRLGLAFTFAALSEFSMGNGIGAPVMLAMLSILMRRSRQEIVASGCAAIILVASYMIGYSKPPPNPLAITPTLNSMAEFLVVFLGNPLFFIGAPVWACAAMGFFTLVGSCWIGVHVYLTRQVTPYRAFLFGLILFVFASGAAATIGRSPGGIMAAIESRYTTGPLLGWLALALLAFDVSLTAVAQTCIMLVSVVISAVIALSQGGARADNAYLYDWKLGLLGQRIGLDHKEYSGQLFPLEIHSRFVRNANLAADLKLGIYGQPWLHDAGLVKFDSTLGDDGMCRGYIDTVKPNALGATVGGWAVADQSKDLLIVLTDDTGKTVGYGVTGARRSDVTALIPSAPATSGWVGFASQSTSLRAYVYSAGHFCKLGISR
ncbi:hypothetical protein [Caballeronia sp. 15711]|uniref:hypothetical protein n=1 Tax=Caballeronia sp. 15711 TaxID=3391029 RepID=UPI0039E53EEE